MKKKFLCLMLTLVMVFSLVPSAVAANDEATEAAEALYELGLFRGTGTNPDGTPIFALDQTPTRNQAVIMLVRLLGKEEEALAGNWELPFTDVAKGSTAYPYIGYAYANGLTNGTSATTYSGTNPIRANQYIAFVLRSLGYVSGEDFQVGTSWELSDELGITNGEYADAAEFTRGDVAIISYKSLSCEPKADLFENIPAETTAQKQNYKKFNDKFLTKQPFPITSKGLTLTWEQARTLVGQDLATVKKYVQSLEDVLYYMVASGYSAISGDLGLIEQNPEQHYGWEWHFNYAPAVVLAMNKGNCGGTASFVSCLLEGDYDEEGVIHMTRPQSGHVANYIKDGDTYVVFDLNQFAMGYDQLLNLNKDADLNTAAKQSFGETYPLIFTYAGGYDGDIPSSAPKPTVFIPEGFVDNINIVQEDAENGLVLGKVTPKPETLEQIEAMRNQI